MRISLEDLVEKSQDRTRPLPSTRAARRTARAVTAPAGLDRDQRVRVGVER